MKNGLLHFTPDATRQLNYLGVAAVYLFGSRATGMAYPFSDYDFGIVLQDGRRVAKGIEELYSPIYDILSKAIGPRTRESDQLDIVFLDSPRTPLELKQHIISHGQVAFDGDPRRRVDLEERVMEAYCDFRPLLNLFDQAVLARIS